MRKLGPVDLEILDLAIEKNGSFNENNLENSELKRLGVGRILDVLASLKDRKMISFNRDDGSFSITELAREILWSDKVPTWAKIMRLLQIKSCDMKELTCILRITEENIIEDIEKLRKNQLVLMSPQRRNDKLVKVYEILSDGITQIDKTETEGFEDFNFGVKTKMEIPSIIDEIVSDIQDSQLEETKKDSVLEKLYELKDRLGI